MTLRSHKATGTVSPTTSSPLPPGTAWATAHPKIQWDQRGKQERRQRLLRGAQQGPLPAPGSPSARRELQQQENATFHPRNATGISSDQHRPPAPPLWKYTSSIPQTATGHAQQLELFLGTERPDKFRAISVPHWGWMCWGWLCRCAQMCTTGGSSLGVTIPTPRGTVPTGSRGGRWDVTPSRVLPWPWLQDLLDQVLLLPQDLVFKDRVIPLTHQTPLQ